MVSGQGVTLVTGGAGFIGSHVVDELVAAGRRVRVLDLLHPLAHSQEPAYLNPRAEYVWGDVRDPTALRAALDGVDAISHQAAMVGLAPRFADTPDYVSHNSLGTARLLAAAGDGGVRRLVLAGSMVVYGEGRYRCRAHGEAPTVPPRRERDLREGIFDPRCERCGSPLMPLPVGEEARPDPRNVYADTKLNQEHLCASFARETGCEVVVLRYHNVFGPRMPRDTPYAGVASIFGSSLAAGEPPRVFEDGAQRRDFVDVRDVARANRLALETDPSPAGPLNIGSGTPRSIGEIATAMAAAAAGPAPVVTGEFRLGDVRHIVASTARAAERLDFRAAIPFADSIAELAELAEAPLRG